MPALQRLKSARYEDTKKYVVTYAKIIDTLESPTIAEKFGSTVRGGNTGAVRGERGATKRRLEDYELKEASSFIRPRVPGTKTFPGKKSPEKRVSKKSPQGFEPDAWCPRKCSQASSYCIRWDKVLSVHACVCAWHSLVHRGCLSPNLSTWVFHHRYLMD